MGARSCGISLRVFNTIAHEWDVELYTRGEISYLQATMYYFVYHINTKALYWLAKSTLLMNEWMNEKKKKIDNPWIKIVKCVGAPKMKTCGLHNHYKIINGLIFNMRILSYWNCTDKRNLSGTRPKSACGKSSSCWFSFSAGRNSITKATEYVTFGFSFRILVFFPL